MTVFTYDDCVRTVPANAGITQGVYQAVYPGFTYECSMPVALLGGDVWTIPSYATSVNVLQPLIILSLLICNLILHFQFTFNSASPSQSSWNVGVPRIDLTLDPVYVVEPKDIVSNQLNYDSSTSTVSTTHSQVIATINCDFTFDSSMLSDNLYFSPHAWRPLFLTYFCDHFVHLSCVRPIFGVWF